MLSRLLQQRVSHGIMRFACADQYV